MSTSPPHFLLYSDTTPPNEEELGGWRFLLQTTDGSHQITASEREPEMNRSRLELLAVIRGLEALDQPSRVTLFTSSRYVGGGLRYGLEQWRQTNWQWDHFGVLSPIKNEDYWRRLDHALQFHRLDCHVRARGGHQENTFEVESRRPAVAGPAEPVAALPLAEPANDPHWPRRPNRWRQVAMALGTAAAAVTGIVACRV